MTQGHLSWTTFVTSRWWQLLVRRRRDLITNPALFSKTCWLLCCCSCGLGSWHMACSCSRSMHNTVSKIPLKKCAFPTNASIEKKTKFEGSLLSVQATQTYYIWFSFIALAFFLWCSLLLHRIARYWILMLNWLAVYRRHCSLRKRVLLPILERRTHQH